MNMNTQWTGNSDEFAVAITLDFFDQLESKLDSSDLTRSEYARRLGVDPSRVSQMFNRPDRENPSIGRLVDYARALDLKVSIVAYDDDDPRNERGPLISEVFSRCWQAMGKPRDLSSFIETPIEANRLRQFVAGGNIVGVEFYRPAVRTSPSPAFHIPYQRVPIELIASVAQTLGGDIYVRPQ